MYRAAVALLGSIQGWLGQGQSAGEPANLPQVAEVLIVATGGT